MKKNLAVLILSAIGVAILFAQEAADAPESIEPVIPAPVDAVAQTNVEPAVVTPVPAVKEEVLISTAAVPVVVEEIPVVTQQQIAVVMETPAAGVEMAVEEPAAAQVEEAVAVAEAPEAVELEIDIPAVVAVLPVVETEEEDTAETDVIGIADDLTAGAEITGGLISLSLKDVEMQDVVRLFSRLSNANIIVPDMMDEENPKRIDVNLDNVEWRPALKAILDTHGLELIEKIPGSEVYSIRERLADAPEPTEIKVFKLNYATVDEVVKMVDVLVNKDGGQISTYPARNSIVAQGTAKLINDLERIVAAVDLPREQVFIEAKFLELSDSASEQLGIDWNVLGGYKVGVGGIGGSYGYNESRTDNVNKYSDAAGRPFELLESEPEDATWLEDPNNPGFYKLYNAVEYDARPGNDPSLLRMFGITPTKESVDATLVGKTLAATLNADDFNVVMSALKEMNGAKIVSNPKIIVANEQTASIHIGQKKPNIKGTIQTAGDNQVNRVYALDDLEPYFEDGVKVDVTPTVNTEENITVRITPTLDRLDADPTPAPDGTDFWGKSTKTINTVFALRSGQTAAIGGLTEASKSNVDRKIPLLGDLPFLGRLFSYSSKNSQQVETIIFVTVGLANPQDMEFETGLPEDSSLAMRHRAESQTDRSIKAAELDILRAVEAERLQERLGQLRQAEQKRLEKQEK